MKQGIANPPAANDWFTLTDQVEGNSVKAFINHESVPTLLVQKLNQNTKGRVGLMGVNYDIGCIRIQSK